MSNLVLEIMREAGEKRWCVRPYCTTCGSLDYRRRLKEIAGPLGGPLADALGAIDPRELTEIPQWQDALTVAIIDLPLSAQAEGVLKAWLPKARGDIRFADYVLYRIIRGIPAKNDARVEWIETCLTMAIESRDFSLIESLVLVLGRDALEYSELAAAATEYARGNAQMRRVLLNACGIHVESSLR